MSNKSTLDIIQIIARIGKILSKIVNICCIVGAVLCCVGIITLSLLPRSLQLGGVTIHGLVDLSEEVSMGTAIAAMAVGLIMCVGEFIVSQKAVSYFSQELEEGTPFTFSGAASLMKLGRYAVIVPIVTVIVAGITHGILSALMENVGEFHYDSVDTISLGIMFVVLSFICKYGAEREGMHSL